MRHGRARPGRAVVHAAPAADFAPPALDFGLQHGSALGNGPVPPELVDFILGGTGESREVLFRNIGSGPLTIHAIESSGVSLFQACGNVSFCQAALTTFQCGSRMYYAGTSFNFPIVLQAGETCRLPVFYIFQGLGPLTAEVRVVTDAPGSPHILPVTALRYTYGFIGLTIPDRAEGVVEHAAASGCGFTAASWLPPPGQPGSPSPAGLPPGAVFPHGLFQFEARPCTVGGARTFAMSFYPVLLPGGTRYFKYGPTPDDRSPHWYELPVTITYGYLLSFTIVDGGLGDDDLVANGVIVDQGGPAIIVDEVPTLQALWIVCSAALLLISGLVRIGRLVRTPQR